MITFKKLRYKNFLSTGNQFIEIDFCKSHTNLVVGTNGAGKSTMLDALCFVLFNKSFRKITKPQLANSTNEKDCLVEIEFSVNNREYLVRRGIKPNIFDIEVNGKQLHKEADDRANQKILEDIKQIVLFEPWNSDTMTSLNDYMISRGITYRTDELDENKLSIYVLYGDNEHKIPLIDWSSGTFSLHEEAPRSLEHKVRGMQDEPIFSMTLDSFVSKYSRALV